MATDLTSSLLQMLNGSAMDQLSNQLGVDQSTAENAVGAALPLLLGALGKNASSQDGASALFNALSNKHDGSVLNDLSGYVAKGGDLKDGKGILRHTLGSNQANVERALSQASGLNADSTNNLLAMLAPLVMGAVGQQTRKQGLDVGGLAKMLLGEQKGIRDQLGPLGSFLDMNHDGSIVDDVANLGSRLLGGLFGGKK